ncbi:unnamed protein product [Lota lota]
MIKCLSTDVQSRIRSGIAIASLQQGIEELVLNSIDAGATCVGVRMDMKAFKVQVIDNGSGMDRDNLERVGNRYCTSKCTSVEDLENLTFYGFRGEALASIVSLATLVEISSRTRLSVKTHVKVFKNGKGLDVFEAETSRPSAGTTLTICNFFHNMPVRKNRIDPVLEAERIRQRVEAISLMHPSVSFTLKNDVTGAMLAQLSKARNTYHRFVQIYGLGRGHHLREISHSQAQFKIIGHIGIEGHYNKSLQFLYVNERLLLKTRLHKLLNFLLRKLNSSVQKNDSPDGQSIIRSPKHKRGQELHAIYIINIKCCYSEYDICLDPAKTLIEFKDWDGILLCVEQTVKAFRSRENLGADPSQEDLDYAPQNLLCAREQQVKYSCQGTQLTTAEASLNRTVGGMLSSGPVHRKVVVDGVREESGGQTRVPDEMSSKAGTVEPLEAGATAMDTKQNERPAWVESRGGAHGIGCTSRVDQLDGGPMADNGEGDVWPTAKRGDFTASPDITQETAVHRIGPHQQSSNRHGDSVERFRKISLADAYIHESLQAKSLDDSPTFCQLVATKTCQQNTGLIKHKLSAVDYVLSSQKVYLDDGYNIPSKVPKLTCCKKVSLSKDSASLDRFRSTYGKPVGEKMLSIAAASGNKHPHPRFPTGDISVPGKDFPIAQNEPQNTDFQESIVIQTDRRSQPTFPTFTKLKPISDKNGSGGVSLAAKLSHLKQQKVVNLQSQNTRRSEAIDSRVDAVQDRDDNHCSPGRSCGGPTAPDPVPALHGGSSPELMTGGQEVSTSGDWLDHFDDTLGKMVYVNKVTGLSRYEVPATADTQVCCTSDVTSMAVNVLTETGFEYRCYPFQMAQVLPFLPRAKRVVSSGAGNRGDMLENSLSSMYSKWKNPVFVRPPVVGVDISSDQADVLAVKIHNILFPYVFSKAMINSMKVIHQVDKKFLACLINTRDPESAQHLGTQGNLLVLVDQHAAHERVRLEKLIADSYEDDPDAPGERRLCSSSIAPPLELSVTEEELRLLRGCQAPLRGLGLQLELPQGEAPRVLVGRVPLCFAEKEHNEVRRGRPSVIKALAEEYLREQIEIFCSTGSVRGTLPLTVLRVLASLACHGAIKFNDVLSRDECHSLVGSLSACQLPFQCAHGRPSIAPLVDTLFLDSDEKEPPRPNLRRLRRMYKAWQLYGNGKL